MSFLMDFLTRVPGVANQERVPQEDATDIFGVVVLGVVVLIAWLVVAAARKKLSTAKGRIGELKEEGQEAVRSARLWAEAKRKTKGEEDEEEEEQEDRVEESSPQAQPGTDIQTEMLEKARARRKDKPVPSPRSVMLPRTLEEGLKKTREGFVSRLSQMFGRSSLEEDQLEEIEEILFTADIGVRTSKKLIDFLQNELDQKDRADPQKLLVALKEYMVGMLSMKASPMDPDAHQPFVILVVGVNGTGKTTTIGKLALKFRQEGKKVILGAADTFRAAAQEQLKIWGLRADAQVVSGQQGADPASVVFDAIQVAKSQGADIVIADTAGRLHTKVNLIEELRKVHRVCGKAMEGSPHEVLLVLDATTGQNAINQAKQFHQALKVTGIALTKLDGTAKGGVILGVGDTFGIPVRFIGIGEQVDDLRSFDPQEFVKALFAS